MLLMPFRAAALFACRLDRGAMESSTPGFNYYRDEVRENCEME
jgi:hypothetical protein